MSINRRNFVKAGVLAAAVAAFPLRAIMGQSFKERDGNPGETPPEQTDPLANYSKSSFVSYLNSIFQIQTVSGAIAVTLAKVDDMSAPKGGECFSLLFRGSSKTLKQDTYTVVHPSLGTFQLFIVPAGFDQNGAHEYTATINRLSPADFANMSAPARISAGFRSNGSSAGKSTSTGNSTSTRASTSTPVTAPAATTTKVDPVTTTMAPVTVAPASTPAHRRKRKPRKKRVDPKAAIIY